MLSGKTALITGGSRGIGRATAIEFASQGADVAIIYAGNETAAQETLDACREKGVRAMAYKCDVSDFAAAKETVAKVKADLGRIDVLVNSAGITRDKLIAMMGEEDFDSVLDVNLKGAFNMIKHCAPIFIRQRGGRIINISSVSGLMGNAGQANYSASKAGLVGLTKSAARELAGRGVTCNAIAPGFIKTDMTREFQESEEVLSAIPLKRVGEPEEVARLAAFLAGDGAGYITGEVIRIDGGMAM